MWVLAGGLSTRRTRRERNLVPRCSRSRTGSSLGPGSMASPSCGLFSRTAPIRTADRKHTPPSGPAARRTRGRPGYWDWAREPALWEETFPGLDFGICSVTYRTFTVSQRLQLKPPIVVGFEHYIGGADAFLVAEYPACRPVHGRDGPSSCCPRPLGQALRARRSGNRPIRVP